MFLQLTVSWLMFGAAYCDLARTNMLPGRSTIVHLFEWKWTDIAEECERFLGPHGFGGVQVSPASENLIIHLEDGSRPWYERYQVMSYKLKTRSGNEEEFANMTRRCNDAGVRIYVDVVINHMTGNNKENIGTAGSTADFEKGQYFGVPYNQEHFHPRCEILDFDDVVQSRSCRLVGLRDLNHNLSYVQNKIVDHLNQLVSLGVAGFRVDAAKHIWPSDLKVIYDRVNNLNTEFGFKPNTRPYIFQEISYNGHAKIKHSDYTPLGDVTEFRVGSELTRSFSGQNPLKWLVSWGEAWNLSPSDKVLVFIDNHDTQRDDINILTYKKVKAYKAAIAFMLAHPYGSPRLMSSYSFNSTSQGPPHDANDNILSPSINKDETCGNGWVCEHRWLEIYQMVAFKNVANDTEVQNWWDNGNNQIAFSRGHKAFIAFNIERDDMHQKLQTGLPEGEYCDVIHGKKKGPSCTGNKVRVDKDGIAFIHLPSNAQNLMLAIHVGPESAVLPNPSPSKE